MKKVTLATVKSFIKKNNNELYIKLDGSFSGMTDCIEWEKDSQYVKAETDNVNSKYTLGIKGAWFVGSSRDYFYPVEEGNFKGIKVSNSCGYFTIAIKK